MSDTRAIAKFHVSIPMRNNTDLLNDKSMNELRQIAKKIWPKNRAKSFPVIVAGAGVKNSTGKFYLSYCDTAQTPNKIMLVRDQRNIFILCHELAHALGRHDHDDPFMRSFIRLLVKTGCCSGARLREEARNCGYFQ